MVEKKRTLWPLGILLIIVLGIVLIAISIGISSRQSIDTDNTFDMKRLELNENINEIMRQQNLFESQYSVHISTMGDTSSNAPLMQNPYYTSPVPRKIPDGDGLLKVGDDTITIYFEKKNHTEKSSEFKDYAVFPYMFTFVRLDQGKKNVDTIYATLHSSDDGIYTAKSFDLPKDGFYQVRLGVMILKKRESNQTGSVQKSEFSQNKSSLEYKENDGEKSSLISLIKSTIMRYTDNFTLHKVYFYQWIFNAQNHTQATQ